MSRWYWAGIACAALFVITWLMPAYVTDQGGGVWWLADRTGLEQRG
jgi:hypothetical protein